MMHLIPALEFKVARGNWPVLFATDSEGAGEKSFGGFGIVGQTISQDEWAACAQAGSQPSFTVSRLDGSTKHLRDPLKELKARIPVPRIPMSVIHGSRKWFALSAGRWKYREHITLTEGRATNILLQRLALIPQSHGLRHLGLGDNLGWCAASAKGRSPAYGLNQLLRRRAALTIATDIQLLHPWVDTQRMPADSLSRTV